MLELHGRRLQSGVWADKLKTLVLLFICSCSFCKPEQTSPPHTRTHLVIYLSSPQILLLLSLLICTKHLRSDWLDSFPVIMREETGVRGRSLLSLAPRTEPRLRPVSAQIVFVCVFMCTGEGLNECVHLFEGVFAKEELVKKMFSLQHTCDVHQITSTDVYWAMDTHHSGLCYNTLFLLLN